MMHFPRFASLLVLLHAVAAKQAANFDIGPEFANSHGCGSDCLSHLKDTNHIGLETLGTDFDFEFYATAANFSASAPGELLKFQPMNPALLDVKAGTIIYRIQYVSRDIDGSPVPVTGFIALPYTPLSPDGLNAGSNASYPLAAYAHGTSGIFRGCAPSTSPNLYEYDSWRLLVERGYAVVAIDYAGLGNSFTEHKYLGFPAQANDIYYSVMAARQAFKNPEIFFVRLDGGWAFARCGGSVWKLAESDIVKNDKNYLGTVALAPATKVVDMLFADEERAAISGYLQLVTKALQRGFGLNHTLAILGEPLRKRVSIAEHAQLCFSAFLGLSSDLSEDEIVSVEGLKENKDALLQWQEQMSPVSGGRTSTPLLVVQGLNDTTVRPGTTRSAHKRGCHDGSEIHLREYPGLEHSPTVVSAAPEWLRWVDARFSGELQATGICSKITRHSFDLAHVKSPSGS